jgi:hypothetical protein
VVRIALGIEIGVGVAAAIFVFAQAARDVSFAFPGFDPDRPQLVSPFAFYPGPLGFGFWLVSGLSLLTQISWLIWQYRAQLNVWEIPSEHRPEFSPGRVVGWWLIPLANLVMPFLTTHETPRRSAMAAGSDASTAILTSWWTCWVISMIGSTTGFMLVFGVVFSRFSAAVDSETGAIGAFEIPMRDLRIGLIVLAGSYLFRAVAAGLALIVVTRIERDQATIAAGPPIPARPDLEPVGWVG